jgi:hypothetical protein
MSHRDRSFLLLFTCVVLAACGSDATGPQYNEVSGSYAGVMAGVSQGVALQANFSLTISQTGGSLGGTYALQGAVSDGLSSLPVQGTGVLNGSVSSGSNPSINVTIVPAGCPNRAVQFSGTYDTSNRRLNLAGPVQLYDNACTPVLTYHLNMVLNR